MTITENGTLTDLPKFTLRRETPNDIWHRTHRILWSDPASANATDPNPHWILEGYHGKTFHKDLDSALAYIDRAQPLIREYLDVKNAQEANPDSAWAIGQDYLAKARAEYMARPDVQQWMREQNAPPRRRSLLNRIFGR